MQTVRTSRPINPDQLRYELKSPEFMRVTPDGSVSLIEAEVDATALEKTVAAHVANPLWRNPNEKPDPFSIAALQARLDAALSLKDVKAVLADVIARLP